MSEWIKISDRLPEEEIMPTRVIVGRSEDVGVPTAMEASYHQGVFSVWGPLLRKQIKFITPTHWQPMPDPPS